MNALGRISGYHFTLGWAGLPSRAHLERGINFRNSRLGEAIKRSPSNQISWLLLRTVGILSWWDRGETYSSISCSSQALRKSLNLRLLGAKHNAACLIVPVNTSENFWETWMENERVGALFGLGLFFKKAARFQNYFFSKKSLHSLLILLPFLALFLCFLSRNIWFLPCMYLILVYIFLCFSISSSSTVRVF